MPFVNNDTLDGKNDEALPEISPHGDEGDLVCAALRLFFSVRKFVSYFL